MVTSLSQRLELLGLINLNALLASTNFSIELLLSSRILSMTYYVAREIEKAREKQNA